MGSLYTRMTFVHYLGMVLLVLNGIFFTDNLIGQIVQFVVAFVILIHELDENKNGRQLIRTISESIIKANQGEKLSFNTSMATEFKIFEEIVNKLIAQKLAQKEDEKLVNEATMIIERVKNGWYSELIQSSTSNPNLERFKNGVNGMISATRAHIEDINDILEEYAKKDYRKKLELQGLEKDGIFAKMVDHINLLRETITIVLVRNKEGGLTLKENAEHLSKNVNMLKIATDESASSLKETADAIEKITSNIRNSTEKVIKMATNASELKDSSQKGEKLATQTIQAMDEINEQVMSINEAISVIDQIAFQTNILSLNAAVEAATAGEAGKGFAVVAGEVRNLAARSAEAANEIKKLVENATNKAGNGKEIADSMIAGYKQLNDNITQTIHLIDEVESSSKEQQIAIEEINDSIAQIDAQTQQNAKIARETDFVASQTDEIANEFLKEANEKEFEGKDNIVARKMASYNDAVTIQPVKTTTKTDISKVSKPNTSNEQSTTKLEPIVADNSNDDEWESF